MLAAGEARALFWLGRLYFGLCVAIPVPLNGARFSLSDCISSFQLVEVDVGAVGARKGSRHHGDQIFFANASQTTSVTKRIVPAPECPRSKGVAEMLVCFTFLYLARTENPDAVNTVLERATGVREWDYSPTHEFTSLPPNCTSAPSSASPKPANVSAPSSRSRCPRSRPRVRQAAYDGYPCTPGLRHLDISPRTLPLLRDICAILAIVVAFLLEPANYHRIKHKRERTAAPPTAWTTNEAIAGSSSRHAEPDAHSFANGACGSADTVRRERSAFFPRVFVVPPAAIPAVPKSQARGYGLASASTSASKKPRVETNVAYYLSPRADEDMADAIPSWTQPVAMGRLDYVVLPVMATSRNSLAYLLFYSEMQCLHACARQARRRAGPRHRVHDPDDTTPPPYAGNHRHPPRLQSCGLRADFLALPPRTCWKSTAASRSSGTRASSRYIRMPAHPHTTATYPNPCLPTPFAPETRDFHRDPSANPSPPTPHPRRTPAHQRPHPRHTRSPRPRTCARCASSSSSPRSATSCGASSSSLDAREGGSSGTADHAMRAARMSLADVVREAECARAGVDDAGGGEGEAAPLRASEGTSRTSDTSPLLSTSTLGTRPSPPPLREHWKDKKAADTLEEARRAKEARERQPTIAVMPVLDPPRLLHPIPHVPKTIAHLPMYSLEALRAVWREACAPLLYHCRCTICERTMAAAQGWHPAKTTPAAAPAPTPAAKAEDDTGSRGTESVVSLVEEEDGLTAQERYWRQVEEDKGPGAAEREMALVEVMQQQYRYTGTCGGGDIDDEGAGGGKYALGAAPAAWVAGAGRKCSVDELEPEGVGTALAHTLRAAGRRPSARELGSPTTAPVRLVKHALRRGVRHEKELRRRMRDSIVAAAGFHPI
ncbi:hypothetical protein B0H11DRAFT_2227344 [Mycena galericulata]|nr:hypothetical protein B0H11DRAFT_2227344 [Mycena galericulata]